LGKCEQCRTQWRIYLKQVYPKHGNKEYQYEVVQAVRLHTPEQAEANHYDPFIFVVKAVGDNILDDRKGRRILWFPYWTYDRKQRWAFGQYPALVDEDLFRKGLGRLGKNA